MAAAAPGSENAQSDAAGIDDTRVNLIVLFGGQSAEHDVSCTTAAHVLKAADPQKYRITPIGISRDGTWAVAGGALLALAEGSHALPGRLDPAGDALAPTAAISPAAAGRPATGRTVVVPLLHGPLGEDGTVQGMLELANVPYVGTGVLGSALAMDKAMAKQVAAANGIPQARYVALRAHEVGPATPARVVEELGLPVFVKPANMGSSVGVTKAKTVEAVRDAIGIALSYDEWIATVPPAMQYEPELGYFDRPNNDHALRGKYLFADLAGKRTFFQAAVYAITGREIEVAVLGNLDPRASVPGEIVPGAEFYDYADKYVEDGSQALVPAPLTPAQTAEVQALALQSFTALRCEGLSRVDFFFEEGGRGFLLNEINTMPGFTPISMYPKLWIASGISYSDLIAKASAAHKDGWKILSPGKLTAATARSPDDAARHRRHHGGGAGRARLLPVPHRRRVVTGAHRAGCQHTGQHRLHRRGRHRRRLARRVVLERGRRIAGAHRRDLLQHRARRIQLGGDEGRGGQHRFVRHLCRARPRSDADCVRHHALRRLRAAGWHGCRSDGLA